MKCLHPLVAIVVLGLASCAKIGIGGGAKPVESASPFGSSGIPPAIRARGSDPGIPVVGGGNATSAPRRLDLTPEDEIVFTDPDNPDASLSELTEIFAAAPKRRGPWEESETIARQRSSREGKPLLIWFTDSARSPMCKAISQELFSLPEFEEWASEKIIRLRVDSNIQVNDPDITLAEKDARYLAIKNHVARMKKTYKVLGHPSLIVLDPGGAVIARPRGFKRGQADFTWGLIKHAEAVSANAYQEWKKALEKKGYRDWHDRNDRKIFAKLVNYSKGTLTFIEPDGSRSRTHENKLSRDDQDWIDQQKRIRGL